MSIPFTRKWRAPKWMPMFIRRRYLGVWTQAEVDRIKEAAHMRWLQFDFIDDDSDVQW